jgi:hypothetical protein
MLHDPEDAYSAERPYDELRLRISRLEDGYRVTAEAEDGSATGSFARPFTEPEFEGFLEEIDPDRNPGRRGTSPDRHVGLARDFGRRLADALLAGQVRDLFLHATARADDEGRGLRLSLGLTDAPELMEVPWEFLHDGVHFIGLDPRTPIVRSLDGLRSRKTAPIDGPLTIVGIASLPDEEIRLDVGAEKRRLSGALAALRKAGRVNIEWLRRPTLAELLERVKRPEPVHVLHFVGHGRYDLGAATSHLIFETPSGGSHDVGGEELANILRLRSDLRLVILNACEGARTSHVDPFSGVATTLLRSGTPAVIAMQFTISDPAAVRFTKAFFDSVASGRGVDTALSWARSELLTANHGAEFGTPVLFAGRQDLHLFEGLTSPAPKGVPAHAERARSPATLREWEVEIVGNDMGFLSCLIHTRYGTHVIAVRWQVVQIRVALDHEWVPGKLEVGNPLRFQLPDGPSAHEVEVHWAGYRSWIGRPKAHIKVDGEWIVRSDEVTAGFRREP